MTDHAIQRPAGGVPREVLVFATALIAMTIGGAAIAKHSGIGRLAPAISQPEGAVALRFEDQPDGSVLVRRGTDGATLARIAPQTNAFLRATVRGLARERERSGIGAATPFVLTAWRDGRLSLDDPTTGRRIPLEAFGETNAGVFAALLQTSGALR